MSPRPLDEPEPIGEPRVDALRRLMAIVDRLRDAQEGCPWDLEQTLETIAPHHIEEAHELAEAIEAGDDRHIVEEAGDLLMGVLLLARIAEQEQRWDLADVAGAVSEKLIRRHPHVFGDVELDGSRAAFDNWERIKQEERVGKQEDASAVAGVPVALPALHRARRMGDKAISHGFRWSNVKGALDKLREEVDELAAEMEGGERGRIEHELGDVLLAGALLGCYLEVDPERATRAALRRFESRFRAIETDLDRPLKDCTLDEMLAAWRRAKDAENQGQRGA